MGARYFSLAKCAEAFMTWKIELAALAITAAGVGGCLLNVDMFAEAPVTYHDQFTVADYQAFDRDFEIAGDPCEIGLKDSDICLNAFESDHSLQIGEQIPENVLRLNAGMRILLALDSKNAELQTIRLGQTLALVDRETQIVADIMRLDAPTYADARTPKLYGASNSAAAN